ncbi:beta-ketoacyl synthase N-terminal-like domain-containing protein [Paenibacillus sp. A3]|uniref:beta-ketoacyl synthase N-terminal-like domain-containing protein n=1 Tax=Paenibacillus sp. A3 TaxID=1337054 RepID=UPI0006D5B3F4|nr:beta-ketoacyl synthase N-terminal-like domain-containing protein [Paenibacillus sp. A3]
MTLTEIILNKTSVEERHIVFVKKQGEEKKVSYRELLKTSSTMLGFLQSKGIRHKEELVFQLKDNEDFIYMFWAGILGGMVPVPVTPGSNDEHRLKFFKVWNRLNNPYLICDAEHYDILKKYADSKGIAFADISRKVILIAEVYDHETEGIVHESQENDTAFIQFSSGSTGDPKGVVLTHRNLLANIEGIVDISNMTEADSLLTWLPLTHDMGIIGCHLMPVVCNIDQVQIQTNDFVRRPTIWLEKASQHRSTILFSPNFGYRYILKFMKKSAGGAYDLSHVRKIFNGAEPISPDLCEEFLTSMSEYNLSPAAMYPGYGLAEASLVVSFPDASEENIRTFYIDRRRMNLGQEVVFLDDKHSAHAAAFVDVGYPIKHTSVRITNAEREPVKDNIVGFIEIKGENVTSGYYNMKEKTKEVLNSEGWLNTGDVGFMRNGRLVVIGRYKDVLFLNGQNHYAHDLERIVLEVAGIPLTEAEVAIGGVRDYKQQTEEVAAFVKFSKKPEDFLSVESNVKREVSLRAGIQIAYVVPIKQIPKTTSGKVQRFNLVERFEAGEFVPVLNELADARKLKERQEHQELSGLERAIASVCQEYLEGAEVGLTDNFFELGFSSIQLNQIAFALQELYGDKVRMPDLYANPTIRELARYIQYGSKAGPDEGRLPRTDEGNVRSRSGEVAIVGIAVKLPKADNLDDYWETIISGRETVGDLPANRQADLAAYAAKEGYDPDRLRYHRASYLDEIDTFDYPYFKILPVEAVAMSPAQRLFLETAAKAFEDAGYGGSRLKGTKTGVYAGYIGDLDGYKYQRMLALSQDASTPTGYLSSNIAGRVSYIFDLKGPALMVDTACSSSLVALDLACEAIRNGQCEQALVGGVRLKTVPVDDGFKAGFESADGRSRPFDSSGGGTGEGEGVIAVLIKPLSAAVRDRDPVYAVIKGSAVNHDGASAGMSAPNPAAQTAAIVEALQRAKVDPATIGYVEAQGTGAPAGDPIEVQGLTDAYAQFTSDTGYCSIGSVRANIGHLYEVSGLSSLVKCCLMLKHKQLPSLANFKEANRQIRFEESPFYVARAAADWQPIGGVRRCAINNFGFSGTNAHVILEEFVDTDGGGAQRSDSGGTLHLFTLSAKSKTVLKRLVEQYIRYLERNGDARIEDVCYTAGTAREHYEVRVAVLAYSTAELLTKLKRFDHKTQVAEKVFYGVHKKVKLSKTVKNVGELNENDVEQLSRSGNQLLVELDLANGESQLLRVAQIYTRGAELAWSLLYDRQPARRIHLPTYAFDPLKCWPSFELASDAAREIAASEAGAT